MDLRKLDPFYWFDALWFAVVGEPKSQGENIVYHIFEILYAVVLAVCVYSLLGLFLGTRMPAVVIASSSMVPTLNPGDVAILVGARCEDVRATVVPFEGNVCTSVCRTLDDLGIKVVREGSKLAYIEVNGQKYFPDTNGDIVVYHNPLLRKDIIHRAVYKLLARDGCYLLTKGDNVPTLDQDCSIGMCIYPYPVREIVGKVAFVIPFIGIPRLLIPF